MSMVIDTGYERLGAALAQSVDEACDRFEEACRADDQPRIEDFRDQVPEAARLVLVRELVQFEIAARQRVGDTARADDYLARFPDLERGWLKHVLTIAAHEAPTLLSRPSVDGEPISAGIRWEVGGADSSEGEIVDRLQRSRLGRFEIRRELGRGGFGVVHLAYDPLLGREVALKIPHAHVLADPELRSRFEFEARSTAGLNHPNIVPVYEAGTVDSVGFIALAYCPGLTLHDWLRRRVDSVPGPAIAIFLATLAGAIHHAHQQGIIHRDLKPANVLLGGDWGDAPGSVHQPPSLSSFAPKITDFGLAKHLEHEGANTRTGTIAGTPCYMAPEQTGRSASAIGPATDVYSLGAILYELLTGRAPFQGETVLDTLEQVRNQDPIPPRRLRPGVPRDLEIICLKCLEKDPLRRYATALALEEDLRRYLSGHSIIARPTGPLSQVAKWARRRPAVAALVGVSLLALSLLVGSDLYIRRKSRETEAALKGETQAKNTLTSALERERQALYFHRIRLAQASLAVNNVRQAERNLEASLPKAGERDLRGWEWHYLLRQCHAEQFTFQGHANIVRDVALSPDNRRVASVSDDGAGLVWDAATGEVLWTFPVPTTGGVRHRSLAYNPRGDCLAYGDHTRNLVTVFAASSGQMLHTLPGCQPTFSPDGDRFASVDVPPTQVRVFDSKTGEQLHSFSTPKAIDIAVTLCSDGAWLAAALPDQTIRVWNPLTHAEQRLDRPTADRLGSSTLVLSPDGEFLASGAHDGTIQAWKVKSGQELFSVNAHVGRVECLAFSPDGQRLASADSLGYLRIWNLKGQLVQALPGHSSIIRHVEFGGNGRLLASAASDKMVKIWDTTRDPQVVICRGHTNFATALAFSPDSRQLISASLDHTLKAWDPATGTALTTAPDQIGVSRSLTWTADRSRLVACDKFGGITEWDPTSLKPMRTLPENAQASRTAALSPGGKYVAFSGDDKQTITIREVSTGRSISTWRAEGAVDMLAFSADGQRLAVSREDFAIEVRAPISGKRLAVVRGHTDKLYGLTFSPDGQTLAAGGDEDLIRLWDVATGRQRLAIQNRWGRKILYAIAFSTDGSRLATGGFDAAVVIWDTATGEEVLELPTHRMGVTALTFSADGRRLAGIINDGSLAVWDATPWIPLPRPKDQ